MMDDIYNIEKQQTILTFHNFPEKKNLIAIMASYDALYTHNSESYNMDVNLTLTFFQRRLNIVISCCNLFYTDQRTNEMYKSISTENWNRMFDRLLRVGISYKLNSLKSDYQRNDSNANILNRLQ